MEENSNLNREELIEKRTPTYKKIMRVLWVLTILGIIGLVVLFYSVSKGDLPSFEELENPSYDYATQVFAEDNTVLGRYYVENRVPVGFDELSPNLIKALIATEDERYYDHSGIDLEALGRVMVKTLFLRNRSAGGASTITQQLAKQLFTKRPGSGLERVMQKFQEWIIAIKLERKYTKEEIIAMYLNKFNFINGAYGIKAASEIYFGKSQDELNLQEAATLVGMLKNPSLYNPLRRPEKTKIRTQVVLSQMERNGYLSKTEYDSLKVLALDMSQFERKTHADGPAPYFRMELRKSLKKILTNEAERKSTGEPYDIYRDGLKIFTTIDPVYQKYAEEASLEHMIELQKTFDKRWGKEDPWLYREPPDELRNREGTTDVEMEVRRNTLSRLVFESDRAQKIREDMMTQPIQDCKQIMEGFELRDIDIKRMLAEEDSIGFLRDLRKSKIIGKPLEKKYKNLMKDQQWKSLKNDWDKYTEAVNAMAKKKFKMKVFTYENDQFEKDTLLSPIDSIKYHRKFLQCGVLAVDPVTGFIKAWVGGINYKYFQYDHVTSDRQTGSTFKPFIYATAIEQQGFSPCYEVDDIAYTIHPGESNFGLLKDWSPMNAGGEFSAEKFTLFKGLQYSKNTVSVYLMKQLGDSAPVRELMANLGVDLKKVPPAPSICLGSADLSVYDMTGAYTAFANNGLYNKPTFIKRIEDRYGRIIYEGIREDKPALNPTTNYVMIEMLRKVMNQGLRGFGKIKSDLGGKTGTTNDYVDGWFMGMSPNIVVGTWVGGEDRWIRFRTLTYGIGAKMARPVFQKFITKLENDKEIDFDYKKRFFKPEGELGIELDCDVYKDERGETDWQNEGFDGNIESDSLQVEEENEEFGEDF